MNVHKIAKIFVEQDEEIVFVIENILVSESDRVIMVIPHVSAITSSAVSLKILARQILKSDKLVVLACDNPNVEHLCVKAGIVTRRKISDIDKEVWVEAKELKERLLTERDRIKKELLGARTPGSDSAAIGEGVIPAKVIDVAPVVEVKTEVEPILNRPRLKARVVDMNGIKLISGGDITDLPELIEIERRRLSGEDISEETYDLAAEGEDDESKRLIGTDLSSIYRNNEPKKMNKSRLTKPNIFQKLFGSKLGLKLIGGLLVVFLLYSVYAFFYTSDVTFTIYLKKETKPVMKAVKANADLKQSEPQNMAVKAEVISKKSSVKGDAQPTGKTKTGDQAQGEITIYNLETSPVTIPVGTVITELKTGKSLKFTTTAAVTIPAASGAIDGTFGTANVNVKAETFGEDYNMVGTVSYKVGSYATDKINAKSFIDFTKSVTKDITVVSKEDLSSLKESLQTQLQLELRNNLKDLLSNDDILLDGSEKFTEVSYTSTVKEGEQASATDESVKFSAELTLTVTAMKVSKTDLRAVVEFVIKTENSDTTGIKIAMNDPVIDNVKIDNRKATFDMRTNAVLLADLDENTLKEKVKGMSVSEAKAALMQKGVSDIKSEYNPKYIPMDIQKVPDDLTRITIKLVQATN
jgi:hypothetical protein